MTTITTELAQRIEKALHDFTNGRASMRVPPADTDVDIVLADCLTALEAKDKQIAELKKQVGEKHCQLVEERRELTWKIDQLEARTEQQLTVPTALLAGMGGHSGDIAEKVEPVSQPYKLPDGWVAVPVEPTEDMVIEGFESAPDRFFSKPWEWEAYEAMSGCQQAAHRAKLCWAAMIAAAPKAP